MNDATGQAVDAARNIGNSLFDTSAASPTALMHGTLVVLVLVGVALWLLGRSITRPLCALSGLLLGAAAMLALGRLLGHFEYYLVLVIVGAVVGCLMAWFMFRLWMGLSLAAVLAIVVPVAVLQWQELKPADQDESPQIDLAPLIETATGSAIGSAIGSATGTNTEPNTDSTEAPTVAERLDDLWRGAVEKSREWWQGLPGGGKTTILIGAAAGAVFGLFFGMLAPYWSSSGLSALAGTLMVLASMQYWVGLTEWQLPPWLWGPQAQTIGVGLITLVGMIVQWTFFRARPD